MKTHALKRFRAKIAERRPVYGLWVTLESATITEMAVAIGLDWVVIDAEHGHLDWREINDHIRAGLRSETVVLVRLAERNTVLAKRALDIGADGLLIPGVESVQQVEEAVRDCHYPPEGRRGIGGERATAWGQCLVEHASEANEHVLIIPIIENIAAIPHVPSMCEVDGVNIFFFGPADFSASAGYRGQWQGPGVAQQILQLKDTIRSAGKCCGILSTSVENLLERRAQGFDMLGLGTDSGLLLRSMHNALQTVGSDRLLATSLHPADGRPMQSTLSRLPERMRPDRDEVITTHGTGSKVELQRGVVFECLVGEFNSAHNLTTGVVTFQPESRLDCHRHPCSESITVLEGEAEVAVEGRFYRLGLLDNIAIPRWLPHAARNPHPRHAARLHVALASSAPTRELVSYEFTPTEMPANSSGLLGFERVTRYQAAKRVFDIGPGAEFIDYFNAELMPGIEMSGGFGRFHPGGRLPSHVHDFDESICIIRGEAICMVEGRRYALSNCATAMVPRGRIHHFANESSTVMDMIWVYAGPMPERIIMEEGGPLPSPRTKNGREVRQ